jgi:hypothetical protein
MIAAFEFLFNAGARDYTRQLTKGREYHPPYFSAGR